MRIGIDFDNTIVSYGALFASTAVRLGLLAPGIAADKTAVRDALRAQPGGEERWTRLQAIVYGPAIGAATVFPGVRAFLQTARAAGAELALVSHKTRVAAADPDGCDLRAAAVGWLHAHGLVGPQGFDPERIYFEETRAAKIARLAELQCSHAIDDLTEVFEEPAFPRATERWLFAPAGGPAGDWHVFSDWAALRAALFPDG